MENTMNKLLATVAMIGSMSFAASASADEYATITHVNPNYQNVSVPKYRTDCRVNQVPIYGSVKNGQASTGDTILGAIIGGAVGNQFGGGKGKDAATILGAIVGADIANKNSNKPGSVQRQCQIETRYEERQREIYSHSTVTFSTEGKKYTVKFQKN